jgi:hypothetical protein
MQIEDYGTQAEQKFRENFSKGWDTVISEARPKKATRNNTIRAELIRREDKQRTDEWDRAITSMDGTLARELIGYAHLLRLPFKWIFGYGHQPARALLWVAGLVAITTLYSHETYIRGQFAPTSAVVLTSKEWLDRFPDAALPTNSPLFKVQL